MVEYCGDKKKMIVMKNNCIFPLQSLRQCRTINQEEGTQAIKPNQDQEEDHEKNNRANAE